MLKSIIEYRLSVTHNFKLSVTLENKDQSLKVMFFKIQSTSRLPRLLIINACSWAQSQPYRISISSGWNMESLLLISSPHTYYSCRNLQTVALICINKFILILVNRQKSVKYEVLQFLSHFIRPANYWKLWRWRNDLDSGWKKKKKNNEENRETKDGFLRQIPLLSGFACRQPRTSVYKLVKKHIWNLNPKKLLG